MCNGDSSRVSSGGLLAVLRAPPASSRSVHSASNTECRLFLRNPTNSISTTTATLEHNNIQTPASSPSSSISSAQSSDDEDGGSDYFGEGTMALIIHRDGDLLNPNQHPLGPLHTVRIPSLQTQQPLPPAQLSSEQASQVETWPLSRLDLGVGPTGVVGRRVQLVLMGRGMTTTTVLREGVLGWN